MEKVARHRKWGPNGYTTSNTVIENGASSNRYTTLDDEVISISGKASFVLISIQFQNRNNKRDEN